MVRHFSVLQIQVTLASPTSDKKYKQFFILLNSYKTKKLIKR